MGAHAAAGEVSGLVSDISKMADDDFKLTSVERYSEAPLWAGMASASGLIFEYRSKGLLPHKGTEHSTGMGDAVSSDAQPGCRVGLCLSLKTTNRKQEIR